MLKELLGECNSSTYILSAEGVSELLLSLVVLYCHWLIPAIRGVEILLTLSHLVSEASNDTENVIISILLNSHENIEIPYSQLFCGSKLIIYVASAINRTSHDFILHFIFMVLPFTCVYIHICVGEKQLKMTTHSQYNQWLEVNTYMWLIVKVQCSVTRFFNTVASVLLWGIHAMQCNVIHILDDYFYLTQLALLHVSLS